MGSAWMVRTWCEQGQTGCELLAARSGVHTADVTVSCRHAICLGAGMQPGAKTLLGNTVSLEPTHAKPRWAAALACSSFLIGLTLIYRHAAATVREKLQSPIYTATTSNHQLLRTLTTPLYTLRQVCVVMVWPHVR
jgi:hypothetical protein